MNLHLNRKIKMPRKMNLELDCEIKMHEKSGFLWKYTTVKREFRVFNTFLLNLNFYFKQKQCFSNCLRFRINTILCEHPIIFWRFFQNREIKMLWNSQFCFIREIKMTQKLAKIRKIKMTAQFAASDIFVNSLVSLCLLRADLQTTGLLFLLIWHTWFDIVFLWIQLDYIFLRYVIILLLLLLFKIYKIHRHWYASTNHFSLFEFEVFANACQGWIWRSWCYQPSQRSLEAHSSVLLFGNKRSFVDSHVFRPKRCSILIVYRVFYISCFGVEIQLIALTCRRFQSVWKPQSYHHVFFYTPV